MAIMSGFHLFAVVLRTGQGSFRDPELVGEAVGEVVGEDNIRLTRGQESYN